MELKLDPKNRDDLLKLVYKSIYVLAFVFCLFKIYDFRHLNFGYTALPKFGSQFQEEALPELKLARPYVYEGPGYDGQFYAQLALRPSAKGEEIENAVDNHIYRARRILFSWTAWCLGLGNPEWVLQAYGWQNGLFWLLTGLLLLKWLPPNHWQNTLRFVATFFTAGLVYSFESALLDGPSLFLVALAVYFIDSRRSWIATGILGISGLGKETNLLAAIGLFKPSPDGKKRIPKFVVMACLAGIPFFFWFAYIYLEASDHSRSQVLGSGNFHIPFFGVFIAALQILKEGGETGFPSRTYLQFIALGSLLIQGLYLAVRPKPSSPWWRIGIAYTALMVILGPAVWEHLMATPRVLLPMTVAFNIVFSRRTWLLPVLLFANSLTFIALNSLEPRFIEEKIDYSAQSPLAYDPETDAYSNMEFTEGWSVVEGKSTQYWRWSSGDSIISFRLPGNQKVNAVFEFQPRTISPREIVLEVNGLQVWRMQSGGGYGEMQSIPFVINPGENTFRLFSPQPPERFGQDPRDLSFSLGDYALHLISVVSE